MVALPIGLEQRGLIHFKILMD